MREGWTVYQASDKKNIVLRMLDMIWKVISRPEADYILIDTFSTKNFYFAYIISLVARLMKKKYIPILRGGNLPVRLDKSPRMSKSLFGKAYVNVAPSGYLKKIFEEKGYKVSYITNTIPIDKYHFKKRSRFEPRILWVRSFARHYLPENAVYSLMHLKKYYPEAKLCMIGPDKDGSMQDVKQLIDELNLNDGVEITGAMHPEEWHKKSEEYDIFINTTSVDNTPVSVMEAMALGLPVVSTRAGGVPYLIEDGKDGILVDINRPEEMAEKIRFLIENPEIGEEISARARKKVEKFDWSHVRNLWFEILK